VSRGGFSFNFGFHLILFGAALVNKPRLTRAFQTKGLSLEEINEKFGEEVVVHFSNATEKERATLTAAFHAEDEEKRAAGSAHVEDFAHAPTSNKRVEA
jgi:hypothetical protein